jgi:hypothetical protein
MSHRLLPDAPSRRDGEAAAFYEWFLPTRADTSLKRLLQSIRRTPPSSVYVFGLSSLSRFISDLGDRSAGQGDQDHRARDSDDHGGNNERKIHSRDEGSAGSLSKTLSSVARRVLGDRQRAANRPQNELTDACWK